MKGRKESQLLDQKNRTKRHYVTQSNKAGITFPIGRIGRYMRNNKDSQQIIGKSAPVFFAAVMEYICAEVLEVAGDICKDQDKLRIMPRHLELAIREDNDLAKLFQNKVIREGGVSPYINPCLLSQKPQKQQQQTLQDCSEDSTNSDKVMNIDQYQ